MCSYSGTNWQASSLSPLLNTILRQKLKFDGFVISDYDQLGKASGQQLPTDLQSFKGLNESVPTVLNAGIDMMMIPNRNGY